MIAVPGLLRRDCAHPPTAARRLLDGRGQAVWCKIIRRGRIPRVASL